MKSGFLFAAISMLPLALLSQTEFFGYFETEQDVARISGQQYNYGYNKLRLDMAAYPADNVTIGANLNIQRFSGQRTWNVLDFLPERIWEPELGDSGEFPITLPDTLYLDNVFIRLTFPLFDLTVGKQQISLGTGYAWNPMDIFNQKQLLDPTYEQTGVTALRAEIPLADRLLVDVIMSPKENWERSARFARIKLGLGSFDLTGSAGIFQWERTGMAFDSAGVVIDAMTDMPQIEVLSTPRTLLGGAVVGELLGVGLWVEGAWNVLEEGDDFPEYLVGLDHTFDSGTYLLAEYYHNGSGVAGRSDLSFNDFLYSLGGQTHSLMQDYAFVVVQHPLTDLISVGLLGFANLNDKSFMVAPSLDWSAFENVSISLLASRAEGAEDSEFGLQEWGLRLRLRAYF